MSIIEHLHEMRQCGGPARTVGLPDGVILAFSERDELLREAVDLAWESFCQWREHWPDLLDLDEEQQIARIQAEFINFYADDAVNPYVGLNGRGPWLVTLKGAVLYDAGGYGMLGFGHNPPELLAAMKRPQLMANVMTPQIVQKEFTERLRREIGHSRGGCPFSHFLCMNSGSEAVTVAARISDVNARLMTDPGGRFANQPIRKLSLRGGFHGRTQRPAQFSDSTRPTYCKHLATFRDSDKLITVEPNDIEQLRQVFTWAETNRCFIEAFFMEPVMGEGNPGMAVTPEFYAEARKLTEAHGTLLLVDSIQAGLRAHGVLSIIDYPGFGDLEAPDLETYSKALNGGQYPLSVLAMNERAAGLYRKGVYGNTMTTNPRALEVACTVLDSLTPELRENIRERGSECLDKLRALQAEIPDRITGVQGTGLLFSVALDGNRYKSYGTNSLEEYLRRHGFNVIHGGENSLRYTPPFGMSSEEVDLMVDLTRNALLNGPVKASADAAEAA